MRERTTPTELPQRQKTKQKYRTPRFDAYGTIISLTKGNSGSRADGAGSQGSGNQGVAQ